MPRTLPQIPQAAEYLAAAATEIANQSTKLYIDCKGVVEALSKTKQGRFAKEVTLLRQLFRQRNGLTTAEQIILRNATEAMQVCSCIMLRLVSKLRLTLQTSTLEGTRISHQQFSCSL